MIVWKIINEKIVPRLGEGLPILLLLFQLLITYYQCCTLVNFLKPEMLVAKYCLVKIEENFDVDDLVKVITEDDTLCTQIYMNYYGFHNTY